MTEYPKIRKVTRRDRKTFTALIQKLIDETGNDQLASLVPGTKPSEGKEDDGEETTGALISSIFTGLLDLVEGDVTDWFIDLLGVARDEYDSLPFDIEVYVIEELIAQKAFNNFFTKASLLYKRIRG